MLPVSFSTAFPMASDMKTFLVSCNNNSKPVTCRSCATLVELEQVGYVVSTDIYLEEVINSIVLYVWLIKGPSLKR
jgi:hypothetical protein